MQYYYNDALSAGRGVVGLLCAGEDEHGGPTGAGGEVGGEERGGNIQCEQLLHVPCCQEALLRDGGQSDGV